MIKRKKPIQKAESSFQILPELLDHNPFEPPNETEILNLMNQRHVFQKNKFESESQLTLKERALDHTSHPLNRFRNSSVHTLFRSPQNLRSPKLVEFQQKLQVQEFIDQKREIFLKQLLIDRKDKEIERLVHKRKSEKKNLGEVESKIAETSNQYKMSKNQIDAELTRGRKSMDHAIKLRSEVAAELKKVKNNSNLMKNEITTNQDTLDQYRIYFEFLRAMTPPHLTPNEYFKTPSVLMNEFEKIEKDNLFLIAQCHEMKLNEDTEQQRYHDQIQNAQCQKKFIDETSNKLEKISLLTFYSPSTSEVENLDEQFKILNKVVTKAYYSCFQKVSDMNTLSMLEKIENELEEMYAKSSDILPSFITSKQNEKEKERRDKQRKDRQEMIEQLQKRKLEQAMERANMPIKPHFFRPLIERTLPLKKKKTSDDDQKAIAEEIENEFLYGDIF